MEEHVINAISGLFAIYIYISHPIISTSTYSSNKEIELFGKKISTKELGKKIHLLIMAIIAIVSCALLNSPILHAYGSITIMLPAIGNLIIIALTNDKDAKEKIPPFSSTLITLAVVCVLFYLAYAFKIF
jgi:hypothetical protein